MIARQLSEDAGRAVRPRYLVVRTAHATFLLLPPLLASHPDVGCGGKTALTEFRPASASRLYLPTLAYVPLSAVPAMMAPA